MPQPCGSAVVSVLRRGVVLLHLRGDGAAPARARRRVGGGHEARGHHDVRPHPWGPLQHPVRPTPRVDARVRPGRTEAARQLLQRVPPADTQGSHGALAARGGAARGRLHAALVHPRAPSNAIVGAIFVTVQQVPRLQRFDPRLVPRRRARRRAPGASVRSRAQAVGVDRETIRGLQRRGHPRVRHRRGGDHRRRRGGCGGEVCRLRGALRGSGVHRQPAAAPRRPQVRHPRVGPRRGAFRHLRLGPGLVPHRLRRVRRERPEQPAGAPDEPRAAAVERELWRARGGERAVVLRPRRRAAPPIR
mmetsp:Transcript_14657/g.45441  ORF Transcript_14657/g.45441 Transcript_14657/m.45441 type:complete len:304 (+) Transcript_14657:54-965(+)